MRNFPVSELKNSHHALAPLISIIGLVIMIALPGFGQSASNRSTRTDLQRHNQLESALEAIKLRFQTDSASAAQSLDSLTAVLRDDEGNLAYINYYRGMFYAGHRDQNRARSFQTRALTQAQRSENDQLTGKVFIELGKLESGQGNNPSAIEYYLSAIESLGRVGDHRSLGAGYSLLGNIYRILGEYDKAISYITNAETEYSQIGLSEGKAWIEYSLANIYKDLELYEEALEYFYKSLDVYMNEVSRPGDSLGVAICLDQIGEIYFDQNLFQKAREFVLRSYKIHKQANNGHGIVITLKNLGKIEYELTNYNKALEFLHQARMMKQEGKDVLVLSQVFEYMGRALFDLGQQQAGIDTVKIGLKLASESQQRRMENRLYGVLAEMYHQAGDIEAAYEYLKLQTSLTELLANRLASVKITGMKNFHEREDRRRQLNSLYFENQIIKLKLDEQKSAQMQLVAVVLSVTIFLIILIFMFLSKRKTLLLVNAQRRELESLVATKNKFFSIISHDLRGPLGGTMQLIATAIELFPEISREKILELLKSMNETSRKTYQLLENLLVWSRFQMGAMQVKRQNIDLSKFINDEVSMQEEKAKTKGIGLKNLCKDKMVVFADSDMLGTILRNLLSNAIKFTPDGGEVVISANRTGSRAEVIVKDSGIGIPEDRLENIFSLENQFNRKGTNGEESNGLGLILVREFVEELGGHIDVESIEDQGTTFTFSLQTQTLTSDPKEIDSQA